MIVAMEIEAERQHKAREAELAKCHGEAIRFAGMTPQQRITLQKVLKRTATGA